MDSGRSSDVSPEAMQARIQQARREAETLKDRIKRKKEELADTTRECQPPPRSTFAMPEKKNQFHRDIDGNELATDELPLSQCAP
jgi:guanine nucleotide-binding protein G(I)/G(S)/G(T) subunit beta-1